MKAKCPHCSNTVSVNPLTRLRDVECPECRRLVFYEETVWGKLWTAFCAVCAIAAWIITYRATATIRQLWAVYLIYVIPAVLVIVLAPLGNLLMYLVHRAKDRRRK